MSRKKIEINKKDETFLMGRKMKHDFLVGIDASISSTGITILDTKTNFTWLYTLTTKIPKKVETPILVETDNYKLCVDYQVTKGGSKKNKEEFAVTYIDDFHRLKVLSDKILEFIFNIVSGDVAFYIESYAFAGNGKITDIAEFTGMIKRGIYEKGYTVNPVNISHNKILLTGSGRAEKDLIYECVSTDAVVQRKRESNSKGKVNTKVVSYEAQFDTKMISEVVSKLEDIVGGWKKGCFQEDIIDSYGIMKYGLKDIS